MPMCSLSSAQIATVNLKSAAGGEEVDFITRRCIMGCLIAYNNLWGVDKERWEKSAIGGGGPGAGETTLYRAYNL
jgi:hypothetical protein